MAIRQYIGARYVTKIYENSLDPSSAEWEAGVTYEPLTMVTYLNSSYLSKKEVPGSVGNPAANPSYWVVTGAYNGQIASLQNQIDEINAKLAESVGRYILISDSYGGYRNADNKTFFTIFKESLNLSDDDCYSAYVNGTSFPGQGSGTTKFKDILIMIEDNITDPDTITDVMVIYGANEHPFTYAQEVAAIEEFAQYVQTTYPAAKVTLLNCGLYENATYTQNINEAVRASQTITKYGGAYVPNAHYLLMSSEYILNDGVHPSNAGVDKIGGAMVEAILAGSVETHEQYLLTNSNVDAAFPTASLITGYTTLTADVKMIVDQYNGVITHTPTLGSRHLIKFTFDAAITANNVNSGLNIKFDKHNDWGMVIGGDYVGHTAVAVDNNGKIHIMTAANINGTWSFKLNDQIDASENVTSISIMSIDPYIV